MIKQHVPTTMLQEAINFALNKHMTQKDDCGKPYFNHVSQVAMLVQMVTKDPEIVMAAYLHDVIEDTDATYEQLVDKFGKRVADLVLEVTHDGKKDEKGFYFPRLKSRDAILIKFADRLSNLSRMEAWTPERQEHYVKRSKFWKDKP